MLIRVMTWITVMVKQSLKRQKSPETTTDTQGMSKFLLILRVKYSYFEIFIVVNRPYFVPHTIPYNVFKFSTVPPVWWPIVIIAKPPYSRNLTPSHTTRDAFMNSSLAFSRDASLGRLWCFNNFFHRFSSIPRFDSKC